jgi:hypothetical protein
MSSPLPETQSFCHTLATFHWDHRRQYPSEISPETFVSLYKSLDEKTSSSTSGRHLRPYKAAILSDILSKLHSKLMSIPALAGIPPSRWHQIVDVMLEKKPGDRRIHRLHIIALQESNFNQSESFDGGSTSPTSLRGYRGAARHPTWVTCIEAMP